MVNILWVSIAFPPKNDPESLQNAKYVKYLTQEADLAIDVVTSANPTLWMRVDERLRSYLRGIRQIVEIKLTEPRYITSAVAKFLPSLLRPDGRMSFHWAWRSAVRRLQAKPEVIYSRSFPLSSTLMAMKLQRHYGVPWILHLSDPWSGSPIFSYTGRLGRWHHRMERLCFRQATCICLTSEHTVALYADKYPEYVDKFMLFPNVYDEDQVPPAAVRPANDRLRLVYTGSLNGSRHLRYLAAALDVLRALHPSVHASLDVRIAGPVDSSNRALLESRSDMHYEGELSFDAATELQRTADILLVIDFHFGDPRKAVFFPSKLLDYMLTGTAILGITDLGGTTDSVVSGGGYGVCKAHTDAQGLADAIARFHSDWSANGRRLTTGKLPDPAFSARTNASRLAGLIREVSARG